MTSPAWGRFKYSLAHLSDRTFERKILQILRLRWKSLCQAEPRKVFDQNGIDLFVPDQDSDGSHFKCVVQCKGYEVWSLGPEQIRDALDSVEKFHKSHFTCNTYLFVHNREGRDHDYRNAIFKALADLEASGKAENVELWSIDKLLENCEAIFREQINCAIRGYSRRTLETLRSTFRFASTFVSGVPVKESEIILEDGKPPQVLPIQKKTSMRVSELLVRRSTTRWILLVGRFGVGKTTSALHAAQVPAKNGTPNVRV